MNPWQSSVVNIDLPTRSYVMGRLQVDEDHAVFAADRRALEDGADELREIKRIRAANARAEKAAERAAQAKALYAKKRKEILAKKRLERLARLANKPSRDELNEKRRAYYAANLDRMRAQKEQQRRAAGMKPIVRRDPAEAKLMKMAYMKEWRKTYVRPRHRDGGGLRVLRG